MKRANIAGPKRTGDLISDDQAGGDPAAESQPNHPRHPQSHPPWHRHWYTLFSLSLLVHTNQNPTKRKPLPLGSGSKANPFEDLTPLSRKVIGKKDSKGEEVEHKETYQRPRFLRGLVRDLSCFFFSK
ncbi:hypothetical protein TIFTF001_030019 [Ficus carica]|uniref:Uncharacterized protein n=1 Tax=Ficus carica TaxID=3494 RepID=A0AA88J358_FICCA|nr:hypothetical protein TIFTF001_030019 [Ficus carica]